jgi:hypothetical protein
MKNILKPSGFKGEPAGVVLQLQYHATMFRNGPSSGEALACKSSNWDLGARSQVNK